MVLKNIPLLMTASVDTKGMKEALYDPIERENMYISTILFYFKLFKSVKEKQQIVFVDNSGWDLSRIKIKIPEQDNVQLELISLNPKDFDINLGKGYNEMLLIDMALIHSDILKECTHFFKVTGRYPVKNIDKMLFEIKSKGEKMKLTCDIIDHKIYDWLHINWNGHRGISQYYAVKKSFWDIHFKGKYIELNDFEGRNAEKLFFDLGLKMRHEPNIYFRFRTQARLGGKDGFVITNGIASNNHESFISKTKYIIRKFLRVAAPKLWI